MVNGQKNSPKPAFHYSCVAVELFAILYALGIYGHKYIYISVYLFLYLIVFLSYSSFSLISTFNLFVQFNLFIFSGQVLCVVGLLWGSFIFLLNLLVSSTRSTLTKFGLHLLPR